MIRTRFRSASTAVVMTVVIGSGSVVWPRAASAQFGLPKIITQGAACAGGAVVGLQVARAFAEFDKRRLDLSDEDARKRERGYQIGLALALCAGGAAIAGSIHGKLSERGQRQREAELLAAAADASPRTYQDPDNPSLQGTITPQPSFVQGNEECRIVEDYLAEGANSDTAFVKYCRQPPNGQWQVKTA